MKNLTELVFILDKSGSMAGLEKDTIGGFNSMLQKQKALSGECRITTVLFDNRYELLHDRIDIRAVSHMTERKVMFVIITDGEENSSREFSADRVRKMIEAEKKYGWEFVFLGANIDAVETAAHFGIAPQMAVDFIADEEGIELNFDAMSEAVACFRAAGAVP